MALTLIYIFIKSVDVSLPDPANSSVVMGPCLLIVPYGVWATTGLTGNLEGNLFAASICMLI